MSNQEKLTINHKQDVAEKGKKWIEKIISLNGRNRVEVLKKVRSEFNLELKEASDLTNSVLFELRVERATELLAEIDRVSVIKQLKREWNPSITEETIELKEIANIVDKAITRKK